MCRMVAEATKTTRKRSGRCGGGGSETRFSQAEWLTTLPCLRELTSIYLLFFFKNILHIIVISFLS
jgi:hypothetical protein